MRKSSIRVSVETRLSEPKLRNMNWVFHFMLSNFNKLLFVIHRTQSKEVTVI